MLITGMHHDYETIILTQAHAIYVTKLAKISESTIYNYPQPMTEQ